ncbi:hypothetical protein D3C81_1266770 [compost metagenome]
MAFEQQAGVATGPTAQDIQTLAFCDPCQGHVDQAAQARVVIGECEGKGASWPTAEVVDLHRTLVTFANKKIGADGVAQIGVHLSHFHRRQPCQC